MQKLPIYVLDEEVENVIDENVICDSDTANYALKIIKEAKSLIENGKISNRDIKTFWPPRLIKAYRENKLVGFFGAGISIPSGLPSWRSLLVNYFHLDEKFTSDKELESDPLTLAELACSTLGSEKVQELIRKSLIKVNTPTTNHGLLAMLRLPIYITTNYDPLFERVWRKVNKGIELVVIGNDADLRNALVNNKLPITPNKSYLFKIHGCVERADERMILTRSDYRLHYRINSSFFHKITEILTEYHTLFLGFSHKDPEVTRLVEEAIWNFESQKVSETPHFFSLQFDMRSHTPEIFAARGIVALNPPIELSGKDNRSASLSRSLIDLKTYEETQLEKEYDLDECLKDFKKHIENKIQKTMSQIQEYKQKALTALSEKEATFLEDLYDELGDISTQGVYLLDQYGAIVDFISKNVSNVESREQTINFRNRPYFQQAKSFRVPFVSNLMESIYNEYSTFFICYPLTDNSGSFSGMIFAACQIGQWELPIELSKKHWESGCSITLVDANGICLIPPTNEVQLKNNDHNRKGYYYNELLQLSRRDRLISRIVENVIPLQQDDDILMLSHDLHYYSIATKIENTSWKLAISKPISM